MSDLAELVERLRKDPVATFVDGDPNRAGKLTKLCRLDRGVRLEAADALASLQAEGERLRRQVSELNYALHYADYAKIGLRQEDGPEIQVCLGLDGDKLDAAKRLRYAGLVIIKDSPSGPMISHALTLPKPGEADGALVEALKEARGALVDIDARLTACGPLHTAEDAYDTSYMGMVADAILSIDAALRQHTRSKALSDLAEIDRDLLGKEGEL